MPREAPVTTAMRFGERLGHALRTCGSVGFGASDGESARGVATREVGRGGVG